MQYLILSDIHANWPALKAVLADAKDTFQQIVCCGDLVGYNPHPVEVVEWTRANCARVIRGNHDKVVSAIGDLEWFNEVARAAAVWTREQLSAEQTRYLRELDAGPVTLEHFHMCHGSPLDEDEYVMTRREASRCFASFELPLAFFGHTHVQGGFFQRRKRTGIIEPVPIEEREVTIELEPDSCYMVNPGAVGQPRDGDPRAAYAVYDSEQRTISLRRVRYPIAETADDIAKARLPGVLGLRLFQGM